MVYITPQRTVYLVDSENTGAEWLNCIPTLRKTDKIFLFYSAKTSKYSVEDVLKIMPFKDHLNVIYCENGGHDAMDFRIAAHLGYLVRRGPNTHYVIMSNDGGYDTLCNFWSNVKVSRLPTRVLPQQSPAQYSKKSAQAPTNIGVPTQQSVPGPGKGGSFANLSIPPKAQNIIKSMMKGKYHSDENFQLAYQALVSGDRISIDNAICRIASGCPADIATMKKTWLRYVLSIQKIAKES